MNAKQNAEQFPLTDAERATLREWAALMGNKNLNLKTAVSLTRNDAFEQLVIENDVAAVLADCKAAGPVAQSDLTRALARCGWLVAARLSASGADKSTIRAACPRLGLAALPGLNAQLS